MRRALEEPYDIFTRFIETLTHSAAMYNLLELGALQELPADGSSVKAADIAAAVRVDVSAVTRSFRLILVNGMATETAPDEYAHNHLSRAFAPEALGGGFICVMEMMRA